MMVADDLTVRGMTDQEIDAITSDREAVDDLARTVRRVYFFIRQIDRARN